MSFCSFSKWNRLWSSCLPWVLNWSITLCQVGRSVSQSFWRRQMQQAQIASHALNTAFPKVIWGSVRNIYVYAAGLFLTQINCGNTLKGFSHYPTRSKLDPLCHSALRYVTNSSFKVHHCTFYGMLGWSSLTLRRLHWYIYKIISGKLLTHLSQKFLFLQSSHNPRQTNCFSLKL